jgi:hypothetical protein
MSVLDWVTAFGINSTIVDGRNMKYRDFGKGRRRLIPEVRRYPKNTWVRLRLLGLPVY